jgi:hypothetical protein
MPVNVGCVGAAGSLKDTSKPKELGYRVNYIKNPTFEVNASDWTSFAGTTLTRTTDDFYTGSSCLQVANTSGGGAQNVTRIPFFTSADQWTISAYVKIKPGSDDATYYLRHLQYATESSSAAIASGNIGVQSLTSADGWVRLSGTFTKNPSANFWIMRVVTTSANNQDIFYVDSALAELSPSLGTYFDGSYNGFWAGTPNNSFSGATPYI